MSNSELEEEILSKLHSECDECTDNEVIAMLEQHPECLSANDLQHRSLLHIAAERGKLKVIKYLTEKGWSVDDPLSLGLAFSPLFYAVDGGYACQNLDIANLRGDMVEYLLKHGADPNGMDKKHRCTTPLVTAVRTGNMRVVQLLLDYGADINAYYLHGISHMYTNALSTAQRGENEEMASYLLVHGAQNPPLSPEIVHTKEYIQQGILLSLGVDIGDLWDIKV